MIPRRPRSLLLVLLCLLGHGPFASATESEAERQVRELGMRAAERFAAKDHAAALAAFRDAESWLAKLPDRQVEQAVVRYNIALCLSRLDRKEEALDALESIVVGDLPERTRADHATKVKKLVSQLFGRLSVRCEGGEVSVGGLDGSRPCGESWPRLKPGRYQVFARFPGGEATPKWARVAAGRTVEVELASPRSAPPTDVTGAADVEPGSGAAILGTTLAIGGGALVVGGVVTHVLARGALEEESTAYDEWSRTGDAEAAERSRTAADDASTLALTTYVLYGLGAAAGIGAAVVFATADDAPAVAVGPDGVFLWGVW